MPKGHYPRECSVCRHVDRHRIELALASGRGVKPVATEFKVYWESVRRHWKVHVSPQRKAELLAGPIEIGRLAVRAAEENRSLLDYTNILRSQLFKMFQEQREAGKAYEASLIASKLWAILELIAKLTGELRASSAITINNQVNGAPVLMGDAELARVQALIIRTLRPFPEARMAVVTALEEATSGPVFPDHQPLQIEGTANG